MAIDIGTQLGSYQMTALLGKGGMGEVYRARDSRLKRDVAIKIKRRAQGLSTRVSHDHAHLSRDQLGTKIVRMTAYSERHPAPLQQRVEDPDGMGVVVVEGGEHDPQGTSRRTVDRGARAASRRRPPQRCAPLARAARTTRARSNGRPAPRRGRAPGRCHSRATWEGSRPVQRRASRREPAGRGSARPRVGARQAPAGPRTRRGEYPASATPVEDLPGSRRDGVSPALAPARVPAPRSLRPSIGASSR